MSKRPAWANQPLKVPAVPVNHGLSLDTTITITIQPTGKTAIACSRPLTPAQIIVIFAQLTQANAQLIVQSQSMIIKPAPDAESNPEQGA